MFFLYEINIQPIMQYRSVQLTNGMEGNNSYEENYKIAKLIKNPGEGMMHLTNSITVKCRLNFGNKVLW